MHAEIQTEIPEQIQPDWSRAPEGALYWAVDASGQAFYYAGDIVPEEVRGVWRFADLTFHKHWADKFTPKEGADWRTTKRWRPA